MEKVWKDIRHSSSSSILLFILGELAGVQGPWLWVLALVTCETRHVTSDMWYVTFDTWDLTPNTLHLTPDFGIGATIRMHWKIQCLQYAGFV